MDSGSIDPGGEAFTIRLCNLLRERRRADGVRRSEIARRSEGRFSARDLRRIERGQVDAADATELAALYGADLAAILPARTPVEVDPDGRVTTAGVAEEFTPGDPDAMLTAYLRLIRRLRNAERDPVVGLRRDDIVVLADVLETPGADVTDRLGALMGATRVQRRLMVGLFVAGAVVVGVAVTAVAATTGDTVTTPGTTPGTTSGTTPVPEPAAVAEPAVEPDDLTVADDPVAAAGTVAEPPAPETLFVDEPWSATVGPPGGIDVSPLPPAEPPAGEAPVTPAPPPSPPSPSPPPADEPPADEPPADEPPADVAVGAPPVPDDPAPVPDPPPPPPPPADDEAAGDQAPGDGVGIDDDGNTVAVGPPPVPQPEDPIPTP